MSSFAREPLMDVAMIVLGSMVIVSAWVGRSSLADLWSGFLILALRPFAVGEWIALRRAKLRLRGEVTHIGLCSTRIRTHYGAEIRVPNRVLGTSAIANESRGRTRGQRVRVPVVVGYGVDVDHVRTLLLAASDDLAQVLALAGDPRPAVGLRRLGPRGLELELSVWIEDPGAREAVVDELKRRIRAQLIAAGVELR